MDGRLSEQGGIQIGPVFVGNETLETLTATLMERVVEMILVQLFDARN